MVRCPRALRNANEYHRCPWILDVDQSSVAAIRLHHMYVYIRRFGRLSSPRAMDRQPRYVRTDDTYLRCVMAHVIAIRSRRYSSARHVVRHLAYICFEFSEKRCFVICAHCTRTQRVSTGRYDADSSAENESKLFKQWHGDREAAASTASVTR